MATVYLLSESDFDEDAYVYILEQILGEPVDPIRFRSERSGGVGEVRKKLPMVLRSIHHVGVQPDTYFVIAIDNDRAPEHPSHERKEYTGPEECRHCALMSAIDAASPNGQQVPGVVAIPVQTLEAWLLLMAAPGRYVSEATLPVFSRRDQPAARALYGDNAPAQLKDLVDDARGEASKEDFALASILKLDPKDLAERSPSFARFYAVVSRWRAANVVPG